MRPGHMPAWRFAYRPSVTLPRLAWVARVRRDVVEVDCGESVKSAPEGFFEGTWVGAPGIGSVLDSTVPFGTGMVARGANLFAIPPGHSTALLFSWRDGDELLIANTFVGLLAKGGLELLPEVDYSGLFAQTARGLASNPTDLPTSRGPAQLHLFENQRVLPSGRLELSPKPREKPFGDFADYVARLDAALASALANAPGYPAVIALSRGYDSPTVATLAARHGLREALTFRESRPPRFSRDPSDSGDDIARKLGLSVEFFDRTAYMRRDDLPEAEFLATGYTGEEVTYVDMEPALRHRLMLTGGLAGWMWLRGLNPQVNLERKDFSGCSVTEFRLRLDTIDLPIAMFGMTQVASVNAISNSAEMRPWSVGGYYDKPIARRILQEGGFAHGEFGTSKRAATALMHVYGEALMAPTSVASMRAFAAAEGHTVDLSPRRRPTRFDRGLIKLFRKIGLDALARPFAEGQRTIVQHRPGTGSLLFRWGVAHTRERYSELRPRS
jgi:hypothetical protein